MKLTLEGDARVVSMEEILRSPEGGTQVALPGHVIFTLEDGTQIALLRRHFEEIAPNMMIGEAGVYVEDESYGESEDPDDVSAYHKGGGWYELPDGQKVQGEDAAKDAFGNPRDMSSHATGGGWYTLPDGQKIQGEEAARKALNLSEQGGGDGAGTSKGDGTTTIDDRSNERDNPPKAARDEVDNPPRKYKPNPDNDGNTATPPPPAPGSKR